MSLKEQNTQKKQEKASVCLNAVFNTKDEVEHKSNLLIERIDSLKAKVELLESKINSAMQLNQNDDANRYYDQRESTLEEISYWQGDIKTYDVILQTIDKWSVILKGFFAHQQYKEIIKQVPVNKLTSLIENDAKIGQISAFVVKSYNKTFERERLMEARAKKLSRGIKKAIDSNNTYHNETSRDLIEEEKRKADMAEIAKKYAQVKVPEKSAKKVNSSVEAKNN